MTTVKVYGQSDDLIELDGDLQDEIGCYGADDENGSLVAFSDGTVLRITYGANNEGFWRITRLVVGTAEYTHTPGQDDVDDYSDVVTLEGDIKWAVCRDTLIRPAKKAANV